MFLSYIKFSNLKQNFATTAQNIGSFCGRKVEVLKASTSNAVAKAAAVSAAALHSISSAYQAVKKSLVARIDAAKIGAVKLYNYVLSFFKNSSSFS